VIDQAAHVVGNVDHADFDFGPRYSDCSDKQTHAVFLVTKNMLDFGSDA